MVRIILPAKFSLCSLPQLGRSKEIPSLLNCTAEPPFRVLVACMEGPGEVFDLGHLAEKCRGNVVTAIVEQVGACGSQLAGNAQQKRHGHDFVAAISAG